MRIKNRDYIFCIKWKDAEDIAYPIGVLAKIDNVYYLKTNSKENEKVAKAYKKGCMGLPGFRDDRVYISDKIFDFFERRVSQKDSADLCEELKKNQGTSMVDSFFVEEIEKVTEKQKNDIKTAMLKFFEKQEKISEKVCDIQSL